MPWNDQQHKVGHAGVWNMRVTPLTTLAQSPWGLNSVTEEPMASAGLANHHQHKIMLITTTAMLKNRF